MPQDRSEADPTLTRSVRSGTRSVSGQTRLSHRAGSALGRLHTSQTHRRLLAGTACVAAGVLVVGHPTRGGMSRSPALPPASRRPPAARQRYSGRAARPGAKPGAADDGGIAGRALKTALLSLDAAIRESGADRPGFLPASSGGGPIPSDVRNAYALMGGAWDATRRVGRLLSLHPAARGGGAARARAQLHGARSARGSRHAARGAQRAGRCMGTLAARQEGERLGRVREQAVTAGRPPDVARVECSVSENLD